jgi:hypothetical protein
MSFANKGGYGIWAALTIAVLVWTPWSSANNFKESADKKGCESIITSDQRKECDRVQDAKNKACNRPTECEPRKQEDSIRKLEADLERLKTIPDADKDNFKRSIRDDWGKIDSRYKASVDGIKVSAECIKARDAVQKWFEDVAIPLTERMKSGAVQARRTFVEKYNEATRRRDEARKKLDEKPSDESLRREWEAAREAMAEAQKKIEEFDRQYGPDIEVYADKLVRHYQSEKTNHDDPSKQADARLENCKKVNDLRYPSLPF